MARNFGQARLAVEALEERAVPTTADGLVLPPRPVHAATRSWLPNAGVVLDAPDTQHARQLANSTVNASVRSPLAEGVTAISQLAVRTSIQPPEAVGLAPGWPGGVADLRAIGSLQER